MAYVKITNFAIKDSTNDVIRGTEHDDEYNAIEASFVAQPSATQTLTNKTLALGSNTVSGTTAQFNTALSDGDFATLAGSETLTNKALNGTLGATTPSTVVATDLTTTGNTILGDARTDTLAVGIDNLITDSSGNVLMGKSTTGTTTIGTSITRAGRTNIVTGSGDAIYFYYSASGVNVGSITHSTTAISLNNVAGITFPATQSASTDANTLDDYEEGTWTPTDGSGAGLSITFNNPTYTKIGNLVYVKCSTIVYPTTASGTGAKISGLPFTNSAGDTGTAALVSGSTFATRGLVLASDTGIFLYPNTGAVQATNANMSASTTYGLCAVYRV